MVLIAAVMFLTLGVYALKRRVPLWLPALPIPIATASALHYRRLGLAGSRTRRLQRFYSRASQRLKGLWAGEGFTGDEFDDADHLYARTSASSAKARFLSCYVFHAPPLDGEGWRPICWKRLRSTRRWRGRRLSGSYGIALTFARKSHCSASSSF